mgnify:FL=1
MGKLTGTKTLENLMNCVAGEAQARARYNTFAKYAGKQKLIQIQNIFNLTAANEYEHFKVFYKIIAEYEEVAGQAIMVKVADPFFPVGLSKTETHDNLLNAAEGEREEWQIVYKDAADVADQEGFPEIANKFRLIAGIEKEHEARFLALAENIVNDTVFKKPEVTKWICLNCGYVCEAKEAPKICPACKHPQGYFEEFVANY